MNMEWVWLVVVFAVGLALPVQPGANARLGEISGNALFAALICTVLTALCCLAAWFAGGGRLGAVPNLSGAPWWAYSGGIIGAAYIISSVRAAPAMGSTLFMAVCVAGQLIASLLLDHFGVAGFAKMPLSANRLAGVALIVAGVVLIRWR